MIERLYTSFRAAVADARQPCASTWTKLECKRTSRSGFSSATMITTPEYTCETSLACNANRAGWHATHSQSNRCSYSVYILASRLEGLVTHPLVVPERAYVVSHIDRHERVPAGNDRTAWRPIFAKVTHNCTVPCTHRSKVSRERTKIDILCFYSQAIRHSLFLFTSY